MSLLTVGNPKLLKGQKKGYLSSVLHLAPANLSGKEVCPKRTAGCTAACLNTAGRGGIFKKGETTNVIQQARIRKTKAFFENRQEFLNELVVEIIKTKTKAEKKKVKKKSIFQYPVADSNLHFHYILRRFTELGAQTSYVCS